MNNKPVLTFTQYQIGQAVTAGAPDKDGFSTAQITGMSEAERAALEKMERGYTVETALLIIPHYRKGVSAHAAHIALRRHISRSTVYEYYNALRGAPLSEKKKRKR